MKWLYAPLLVVSLLAVTDAKAEPKTSYGLSIFGDLKYGPDFKHFDYVNPDAPKGGSIKLRDIDSFDTVNPFLLKGNVAVINGDKGGDLNFNFTQLMTPSYDEPDALYGLLAETVTIDENGRWVEFKLRPEARFHDDTPITAEDVAFTFRTSKIPAFISGYCRCAGSRPSAYQIYL